MIINIVSNMENLLSSGAAMYPIGIVNNVESRNIEKLRPKEIMDVTIEMLNELRNVMPTNAENRNANITILIDVAYVRTRMAKPAKHIEKTLLRIVLFFDV